MTSPLNRIECPTCGGDGELWLEDVCGDPDHCSPKGLCSTCDGDGQLLIERWEQMGTIGRIEYRSIDGGRLCYPGSTNWVAADMVGDNGDVIDLVNMRAQMIIALKAIENELDSRGLLDRLT